MLSLLALLALTSLSVSQRVVDQASFGKDGRVSSNTYNVPEWHLTGSWSPQIMSDRIVLTPPYPGNQQGAAWADSKISSPDWEVEFGFRVAGQEHGGGNLQVWYTKEGQAGIGSNSIYTVGKFEGLVLVVDMHGGRAGGIRGFLNDGSIDYKNHHHIEALAFGHCEYSYRNLGRPSVLKVMHDLGGFEVKVDGRTCFSSNEISLPKDYFFGITTASSETPDSFEIFKFVTTELPSSSGAPLPVLDSTLPEYSKRDDQRAASPRSQDAEFAALHDRIQSQAQAAHSIFRELLQNSGNTQIRMEELHNSVAKTDQIRALESKVQSLENSLNDLRKEIEKKDYSGHFQSIHNSLDAGHEKMLEFLPDKVHTVISSRAPNLGFFIFLVIVFQAFLAIAYVVYKRRLASGPKKYL